MDTRTGFLALAIVLVALAALVGFTFVTSDKRDAEARAANPQLHIDRTDCETDRPPDDGNEPLQRGLIGTATESWLRVVDGDDGHALSEARVRLRQASGKPSAGPTAGSNALASSTDRTDRAGRVPLPAALHGRCRVEVRCQGYVPLRGFLSIAAGETRIAMKRGGSLQLRLHDSNGAPAAGVRVMLLAPRIRGAAWGAGWPAFGARSSRGAAAGRFDTRSLRLQDGAWRSSDDPVLVRGRWLLSTRFAGLGDDWAATTGADGLVTWSGLPAGGGYRWGLMPPRHGEPNPPHEARRLREVGTAVQVTAPPPPGLSGKFAIAAGQVVELSAKVMGPAHVRGRIVTAAAASPARVKLYRVRQTTGETATRVVAFDLERIVDTDGAGRFCFRDLRPAIWIVRACWQGGEHDVFFCNQAFRLKEGVELDLGDLHALQGNSVTVSLGVVDSRGRKLEPDQVFKNATGEMTANLVCSVMPDSGDADEAIFELLALPFGHDYVLHGLRPGRVELRAQASIGLNTDPNHVVEVHPSTAVKQRSETLRSAHLDLRVELGVSRPIRLLNSRGRSLPVSTVWVRDSESGRIWPVAPGSIERGHRVDDVLTLPPGRYHLWCAAGPGDGSNPGLCGGLRADFATGQTAPLEIEMRVAAAVRGRLVDAAGRPMPGRTLRWGFGNWRAGGSSSWLYTAKTDEQGRFVLEGLPPDRVLCGERSGASLPPLRGGIIHDQIVLRAGDAGGSMR